MKKKISIIVILLLIAVFGISTVSAASALKLNKTSVTIEKGKTYKLSLKGAKAKKVVVQATQLTKKSVRKCFKGSKVKTVKVPAAVKKAYKKAFAKKNAGKAVKVK